MKRSIVAFAMLSSGTAIATGSVAHAQGAVPDDANRAEPAAIIVTAERRETNLQETPASVAVLAGDALDRTATNDMQDLVSVTPGLTIDFDTPDSMRMGMRGILTSEDSAGTDQAVGVFIDGIYFGRSFLLNQNFSQVERIEVLRGPQGTLYGRNVVGGALSIITKDPKDFVEASASVTVGNRGRLDGLARVAGPVVGDTLLGQIELATENTDGEILNRTTGNYLGGRESQQLKAKLKFLPSADFDLELSGSYQKNQGKGYAQQVIAYSTPLANFTFPDDFDARREVIQPTDGRSDSELVYLIAEANAYLTDRITLSSLTGFIDFDGLNRDFTFLPAPEATGYNVRSSEDKDKTFSQEFRVSYDVDGFFGQAGIFYYRNDSTRDEDWELVGLPYTLANLLQGDDPTVTNRAVNFIDQTVVTNSYAAFGQGTLDITDWLSFTAGVRYTTEKKTSYASVGGDPSGIFLNDDPYDVRVDKKFSSWTPKLTVDALFDDAGPFETLFLYATYAKGWKSGGFDPGTTRDSALGHFLPEKVDNYEAGIRTTFMDGRATFNATGYLAEYADIQIAVSGVDSGGLRTENASATVKGIELESSIEITDNLFLTGGYAYSDATYDAGSVIEDTPVGGNRLPWTPEHSYTIGAVLTQPVADDTELTFTANYTGQSAIFLSPNNAIFSAFPDKRKLTK